MKGQLILGLMLAFAWLVVGCSSVPKAPSAEAGKRPPLTVAKRGNPRSYEVFGQRYFVKKTNQGYRQTGIASWYGPKFHGKLTSTGEVYDMHQMTAAHKTLPIPSYAKVTHLDSGKSITVLINDRGPFVGDRIIDLSYAAGKKLDLKGPGTAEVEVVALPPYSHAKHLNDGQARQVIASLPKGTDPYQYYLQIGAFGEQANAQNLRNELSGYFNSPVSTFQGDDGIYRVKVGPVRDPELSQIEAALLDLGLRSHRIDYHPS